MNERIKVLEAQCWEPRPYGPAWFNSKKFAELIVRECAEVCSKIGYANISDCDGDKAFGYGANFCAHRVKEHFGVEE